MKKVFTLLTLISLAMAQTAISQNITLKFTGATGGGEFVRLDSVQVQNMSRSWSETLVYPDTVLEFSTTGIIGAQGVPAEITAYPNPFSGTTNVTVTMPQGGNASFQVYNLAGQKIMDRTMTLGAGKSRIALRLQKPQLYLLSVVTPQGRGTVKLLNCAAGPDNSIQLCGGVLAAEKIQSDNPFQSGDLLKMTGYATIGGAVVASNVIQQAQTASENFTLVFTTPASNAFSVSTTSSVVFSPGNLQWSATGGGADATTHAVAGGGTAAGTWRFAPNQWDTIGAANSNISSSYTGWIDLFGWGTSGYDNKQPYMTSKVKDDYGNGSTGISGTNYDWGAYNAIYNPKTSATDAPGTWRTLTAAEWNYLADTRTTASGIRYAKAQVNGVPGLILVPDNWSSSTYTLDSTNTTGSTFNSNVITAAQWATLENAGCVFLPASGYRTGVSLTSVGVWGCYWTASCNSYGNVGYFYFYPTRVSTLMYSRYYGYSVRLVRSAK